MVTDILEDQQEEPLIFRTEKSRVEDKAILVVLTKDKGDGTKGDCRQWTSKGSGSRGAH